MSYFVHAFISRGGRFFPDQGFLAVFHDNVHQVQGHKLSSTMATLV
jgi:hypothetical protein